MIPSPRELVSKLPLLADATLMWTMHYHSFVLAAAAAARCCYRRGQSPDDPQDHHTSSPCVALPPPSSAASHLLNPCCHDINDSALVFVVIIVGEGGGRSPVVRGPDQFGGQRRRGLERIPSTSCPLRGGRDFFRPHPHRERRLVIGGVRYDRGGPRTPAHS